MNGNGPTNRHLGSTFDDFLVEEGVWAEVTINACKKTLSQLVCDYMEREGLTKSEMAVRMRTSRQSLDRLLDPRSGVTLDTIERAAAAFGKRVRIEFEDIIPDRRCEERIAG